MTRPAAGLRLDALLDSVGVEPPGAVAEWPVVTGVACDSRRVQPGDLFVAIVGERFDGRRFVPAAVEAGAVAILGPSPTAGEISGAVDVPWIDVASPRPLLGALSARAFGAPGDALRLVGVTGTNGKSTLVHLLGSMLDAAGEPAARLGTLGYFFGGGEWRAGGRTTPEAPDLHRLFADMRDAGARSAAMEVSSHALELGRVDALGFDLAVF
ncbi:MAG: Mur ligase family protein, partial [Acidobacteriota bacterium]